MVQIKVRHFPGTELRHRSEILLTIRKWRRKRSTAERGLHQDKDTDSRPCLFSYYWNQIETEMTTVRQKIEGTVRHLQDHVA